MLLLLTQVEKILLLLSFIMVFLNLQSKPAFAKKFLRPPTLSSNILGAAAIKSDSNYLLKGKNVSINIEYRLHVTLVLANRSHLVYNRELIRIYSKQKLLQILMIQLYQVGD